MGPYIKMAKMYLIFEKLAVLTSLLHFRITYLTVSRGANHFRPRRNLPHTAQSPIASRRSIAW